MTPEAAAARAQDGDSTRDSRRRGLNSTVAEGLANGFAEASLAFSEEVQGGSSYADVLESMAAGLLRANGRFLAELGTAVRRVSDDLADQRSESRAFGIRPGSIDYDRLADLISARLAARTGPVSGIDYDRLADLVADRLAGRTDGQGTTGPAGS
jgi:hypothetical protein